MREEGPSGLPLVSFGEACGVQNSTAASVASDLAARFHADVNSTVDATAANGVITFTGKGPEGGTNYSFSLSSTYDTVHFSHSSFSGTSGALKNGVSSQTAFYSFTIPTAGGFAPNGNILSANDTVNGNWVYTYDSFNRLSSAVAAAKGLGCGWVYDRYGNRWQQNPYTGTCGSDQRTYTMNGANTNNNRMDGASYDALGNLLVNPSGGGSYVYDAESRLISAGGLKYIYDAEGRRVAKLSGTTVTNEYLFDTEGNQQIELNGSGTVLHTNLYAGGKLIATYGGADTYFHFTDWLGTRRYEANSAGVMTETCTNLPFGDSQSCTGTPDATEHHFTGKEQDTESGLDYSGARNYGLTLGRWMSPDSINVTTERLYSPSSTLNKYSYAVNDPLRYVDADGRDVTVFYERGLPTGHVMVAAYNQQTGDFAMMSVGPQTHHDAHIPLHPWSGVPGTPAYNLPTSVQELRDNFSAVTIQTNPEQAQQAIELIRNDGLGSGNWAIFGNNCTTSTAKLLKEIGVDIGHNLGLPWAPDVFMANIMALYGSEADWGSRLAAHLGIARQVNMNPGIDYGHPRFGMDTFYWLMMEMKPDSSSVTSSEEDHLPDGTIRRQ